jgi:hypothetical protein
MNHKWHNNTCTRCGITRKKKKAKIINLAVNRQGCLMEYQKTIQLWNYEGHGFNRPDCPDELAA